MEQSNELHITQFEPMLSHVSRVTVGRLFNLGNYENLKFEITVDLTADANAGVALQTLETVLGALHNPLLTESYEVQRARDVLALSLEKQMETNCSLRQMEEYRKTLAAHNEAKQRKQQALELLSRFGATVSREHHDATSSWPVDGDDDY